MTPFQLCTTQKILALLNRRPSIFIKKESQEGPNSSIDPTSTALPSSQERVTSNFERQKMKFPRTLHLKPQDQLQTPHIQILISKFLYERIRRKFATIEDGPQKFAVSVRLFICFLWRAIRWVWNCISKLVYPNIGQRNFLYPDTYLCHKAMGVITWKWHQNFSKKYSLLRSFI